MKYEDKTKEQLINELVEMQRRVTELEASEIERKRAEDELRKAEQERAAILNSMRELLIFQDLEHRVIWANKAAGESVSLAPEELVGRYCYEIWQKSSKPCVGCPVAKARETGQPQEAEMTTPDGRVWFLRGYPMKDKSGNTVGMVEAVLDITERKRAEEELRKHRKYLEELVAKRTVELTTANEQLQLEITERKRAEETLRESEQKFRILAEQSPNMVFINKKGRIVYANEKSEEIMGYKKDEFYSPDFDFLSLIAPESVELIKSSIGKHTKGEEVEPYECTLITKDGKRIEAIIATRLIDYEGERAILGILTDITQRKEAEEEKEKARAQLLMAHKSLEKVHLELKTLWQSSKEILCKESLSEIINRSYEIVQSLFPDAHIFVSLLEPKKQDLFPLERLNLPSKIVDEQRHFKPSDSLIDWLLSIKESHIFKKDPSIILDKFLYPYPLWYALPIVAESGCIGCVIMAFDKEKYIPKPDLIFVNKLLSQIAGPISQAISMEGQIEALKERTFARTSFHGLVGRSKVMQDIYDLIRDVAPTNATVLITGENGTGKELAAMAIHECSTRRNGPFVVANCSAYPVTLLESELFGHEKGAFTGAIRTKKGRFELAHNGTIFLDEIGELPSSTQLLLLRVLQNRCFKRVGGEKTIEVDVRVIAATNKDLKKEMTAGRFREDLYYRLNVVHIHMPPLREKKEDIPLLCDYFLKKFCEETGKEVKGFTAQAMRSLIDYNWPGNVRELENIIQQAIILTKKDTTGKEVLPSSIKGFRRMPVSLVEHERQFILRVLKECNLNKHEAARRLKISRATLYSKIKRYGLEKIVTFRFEAPQAKSVYLVGSFNQWDTTAMSMKKEESGIWKIDIELAPGTYEYLFYVDGNWQNNPTAKLVKNPFGTVNNVLIVK